MQNAARYRMKTEAMDKSLQQFLLIARLKSISEAAKVLKLSQPTVSSNLKRLENELGAPLFERRSGGMILTEFGHILFKHSDVMQYEYNQMMQKISEHKQYKAGKVNIGTGDAWWSLFVKQALNEHRQKYPSSSMHVEFGNHLSLMDSLINQHIELFVGHEIIGLSEQCDVKFTPLFRTRDAVFVSPIHPLIKQDVSEDMLHEYPLVAVTYDSEKYSYLLDNLTPKLNERKKQCLDERITYEFDSLLASIEFVLESNAVMQYPAHLTEYLGRFGLVTLNITGNYDRGTVGIYTRKRKVSESHIALISRLQELTADLSLG